MCNRVRASFEFRETRVRWNLVNDLRGFTPSYNISPDRGDILAVVRSDAGNEGHLMYWPLIPAFAKEMALKYSTSNTTAERLKDSNVYGRLLNSRRCLIPINGFYEWQGTKPPKTPFYIHLKSNEPFGLAGLWDTWKKPDGSLLESFTIITTEPNALLETIHRRMPVILHREDEARWLDCSANPFDKVQALLQPFPAELMAAYEVSKQVNNPKFDSPECYAPVEG